jgi:hypothetical protein
MDELNNFENNLRKKLEAQDFPFDETNWEKARVMIDDSRKRKKRRFFLLWMLAGISVATTVLLTIALLGKDQQDILANETKQLSGNDQITGQDRAKAPAQNKNDRHIDTESREKPNDKNENIETKITNEEQSLNKRIQNQPSEKESEDKNEQVKAPQTDAQSNSSISKIQGQKNILTDDPAKLEDQDNKTTSVVKSSKEKKNAASGRKKQKPGNNESSIPVTQNHPNRNETIKTENKTETAFTKPDVKNSVPNTTASVINPTTATDTINKEPAKPDSIKSKLVLASAAKDSISQVDSTRKEISIAEIKKDSLSPNEKSEDKPDSDYPKNIFYAELGATYFPGWIEYVGPEDGKGLSITGGINYLRAVKRKFAVGLGVHYNPIQNLTCLATSSLTTYDFGVSNDLTIVNYKTLYYLSLPIRFYYVPNASNMVGIGFTPSYLLTTKSEVTKEVASDLSPTSEKISSSMEKGYTKGFKSYDLQASLFYRRKIYKMLSVRAEILIGLIDVKDNTVFGPGTPFSQRSDKTHGFRMTLCYDIFKK